MPPLTPSLQYMHSYWFKFSYSSVLLISVSHDYKLINKRRIFLGNSHSHSQMFFAKVGDGQSSTAKYFYSEGMGFSLCRMLLKFADDRFHSQEHHKGLSYCKTPEIFDHPLTSPPSPKRGPGLFCPRTSFLLLGVWVQLHGLFCLMGWARLPGKQYSSGLRLGTMGWPGVHGQSRTVGGNLSHAKRYESLQVRQGHWARTSKRRRGRIRCPRGCSYQDRALIYCKQSVIPVPWCINHTAWYETALTRAGCSGE